MKKHSLDEAFSSKRKALRINLEPTIYGTLAEIGAGQEVARSFFRVGGASGTIAKSMSAYDMAFSDSIYGEEESGRYVCESRIKKMLDHEYGLLTKRLVGEEYANRRFFAFANSISTLNFKKTNDPHGWMGIRFQLRPNGPLNDIIVHFRMHDNTAMLQQRTVGDVGVNLIFGCFYYADNPEKLVLSLMDNLTTDQLEIDMIQFHGEDFKHIDNRLISLLLVKEGFTNATVFDAEKVNHQAKDFLYKKDVLVLRGRFRPVTLVNQDMLQKGLEKFKQEKDVNKNNIVLLAEMTLNNLYTEEANVSNKDFLDRAEILCAMGHNVMISNFQEHFKLVKYLSRCRAKKIGLIVGVYNLIKIYGLAAQKDWSKRVLKAFGQLFYHNAKMYAYPYQRTKGGEIITAKTLRTTPQLRFLHQHFIDNGFIEDIEQFKEEHLQIFSDDVIKCIKAGEEGWEDKVPDHVAELIKRNCLFDFPCDSSPSSKNFSID